MSSECKVCTRLDEAQEISTYRPFSSISRISYNLSEKKYGGPIIINYYNETVGFVYGE